MSRAKPSKPSSSGWGCFTSAAVLLFPSADFVGQKFQDHRHFTAIVLVILAVFLPSLWVWVTDPVGAANTIGLRLLYFSILIMTVGFIYGNGRSRLLVICLLVIFHVFSALAAEALFVEILNRLQGGMVYGLAGFMYCMFLSILFFHCFSLTLNIGLTLAAAALPQHDLVRYELQRKLELLSNTDPLPGAKNRRFFHDPADHRKAQGAAHVAEAGIAHVRHRPFQTGQ